MAELKVKLDNGELSGFYDPKFEKVAEEFERNYRERGEVGASACVKVEGETVVDLWVGLPASMVQLVVCKPICNIGGYMLYFWE
jgi:hypothetical protein